MEVRTLDLERRFDVALCGYYGFGNLGDELLAKAAISLLEECGVPGKRIVVLSKDPEETSRLLGTAAVDRWNPGHVFWALRESRTLLLGGGGLFQDSTSVRSSFYYWGVVRLARVANCIPWCFGQSVGPFRGKTAELLARDALGACEERVVRDRFSIDILEKWGLEAAMAPDLVFGLKLFPSNRPVCAKTLLVNIRPWKDELPERLAAAVGDYARREGLELRGLAMAEEDAEIMAELESKGLMELQGIQQLVSAEDCSSAWPGECAGAVGMRLHFCILAVLAGVPLLAVPYDPKVSGLAEALEVPKWDLKGPISLGRAEYLPKIPRVREDVGRIFRETYLRLGGS
jgi:polysaccharide pyruvyl transferase CsaB